MPVPRSGRKRCPSYQDADTGDAQGCVPQAGRSRAEAAGAATLPRSRRTAADFIATAYRVLHPHRAPSADSFLASGTESAGDPLAALLADPGVGEIALGAGIGRTICIPPLDRDVTFRLVDTDSCVEFAGFGCGWAHLQTGVHTRSLAIRLCHAGYRLPRHLLSNLRRDPQTGLHATLKDMCQGGGLTLAAPATVAFDALYWNQCKTDADFRLEMSLVKLLEWSDVLSQGRRLTAEQHRCLYQHVQEMPAEPRQWTTVLANALIDEMYCAATARAPGLRQSILRWQRVQVARLKLYLSGGLLRPLSQAKWREGIGKHGDVASIVARITAVHVDLAWDAMDARRHYQALCAHLHALERSERDPVRRHVLCRDRELLEAVMPVVTGDGGGPVPSHAGDAAACAGDAQRRLVLKINLIGLLDARLFAADDHWRSTLLHRLRQESARPRRALDMHDMALIAFLRHADAVQWRMRVAT